MSSTINSTPSSSSSSSSDVIDLTSSSSDDVVDGEAITTSISSRSRRKSITPDRYTDLPQTKRARVSHQSSTTRQIKRVSTLNKQSSEEEATTTATTATIAAAAGGSARKISSARQNQRAFLNQRSEEGTGGKFYFKNRADNDDAMEASNDTTQEYTGKNINGYFEVDEILDRRTRKYGSEANGLRHVVEYFVSWKIPDDYTGDKSYYDPSWLIAENLDQNSLVDAFRKFPMDGDSMEEEEGEEEDIKMKAEETEYFALEDELNFSDDDEEEEEDVDEEDNKSTSADELQDYEEDEGELTDIIKKNQLGESDYDSPGTVELVLTRRTYRVGQSYYASKDKSIIYIISMIHPLPRQAACQKYIMMEKSFVCPKGEDGTYIRMEDAVLDLPMLKLPCKTSFKKSPMRYEQDDDKQRSFAYYNDTGKIQHHVIGRPSALDMFAGAGGMSLGLEKYFDVKWAVDNDHLAAATLRANKTSDVKVYDEDAKSFLKKSVQGNQCYPQSGEPDHIHWSPPCKGFSRANRNGGKDDEKNNKQTLLFIQAIKHFQPQTASYENVPGLVMADYKRYLQFVVANLLHMNYQVRVKVLVSSDYGDPQKRRRLILFAARSDCILPKMPKPTHGQGGLLPIKTCKDALHILEKHTPSPSKSSGSILIGNKIIFNHIIPGKKTEEDDFTLIEDEPSRTILARARPHLHYNGKRYISVREAACLQSFPITHQFHGSLTNQYSQVGNAVPVHLSTAIARSVAIVHGCPV